MCGSEFGLTAGNSSSILLLAAEAQRGAHTCRESHSQRILRTQGEVEIRSQNRVPSGRPPSPPLTRLDGDLGPLLGEPRPGHASVPAPGLCPPLRPAPPASLANGWGPIKATVGVLKGNQSENSDSGPQVSAASSLGRGRPSESQTGSRDQSRSGIHTAQPARAPGAAKASGAARPWSPPAR